MSESPSATAIVTLTLEVTRLGVWGGDCRVDQVYKQGAEEAIYALRNASGELSRMGLRVIGQPIVRSVVTANREPSNAVTVNRAPLRWPWFPWRIRIERRGKS